MADHAARVGQQAARHGEERHPRWIRRGRDDHVTGLHLAEVLRPEHDPRRPADDTSRRTRSPQAAVVGCLEAGTVEAVGLGRRRRRCPDMARWHDGRQARVLDLSLGNDGTLILRRSKQGLHLGAAEEHHVHRGVDDTGLGEPFADPDRKPAQARMDEAIDPVVVDLGQRPDRAGIREQALELRELVVAPREQRSNAVCELIRLSQ